MTGTTLSSVINLIIQYIYMYIHIEITVMDFKCVKYNSFHTSVFVVHIQYTATLIQTSISSTLFILFALLITNGHEEYFLNL